MSGTSGHLRGGRVGPGPTAGKVFVMGVFRRSLHVSIGLALAMGAPRSRATRAATRARGAARGRQQRPVRHRAPRRARPRRPPGLRRRPAARRAPRRPPPPRRRDWVARPPRGPEVRRARRRAVAKVVRRGQHEWLGRFGRCGARRRQRGTRRRDGCRRRRGTRRIPGGAGTGGSGGSGGGGVCDGVAAIVSKASFDQIFPLSQRNAFYTYDGFVQAASLPGVCTDG